jgi:hypothetical protein
MIPDPIVEEIREIRKVHAAKYGNDLDRIVEALREDERASSHVFVNPGPKLLVPGKYPRSRVSMVQTTRGRVKTPETVREPTSHYGRWFPFPKLRAEDVFIMWKEW